MSEKNTTAKELSREEIADRFRAIAAIIETTHPITAREANETAEKIDPPKPEPDTPIRWRRKDHSDWHMGVASYPGIITDLATVLSWDNPEIEWERARICAENEVPVPGYETSDGPILTAPTLYSGIGVETPSGVYGICLRDNGIEILHNGKTVYRSGQEHRLLGPRQVAVDILPTWRWPKDATKVSLRWHPENDNTSFMTDYAGVRLTREEVDFMEAQYE